MSYVFDSERFVSIILNYKRKYLFLLLFSGIDDIREKRGGFFDYIGMGSGVVQDLLAKAGEGEVADLLERNFVDGGAGWSEGNGEGRGFGGAYGGAGIYGSPGVFPSFYGAQRPDFAFKGLEVWWKGEAAAGVQEGAGGFFGGVCAFIGAGEVEGEGVCAGRAEAGLRVESLEFREVFSWEHGGFPETGSAEAAAELAGGTGRFCED